MLPLAEPALLTLMDLVMMIGILIGSLGVPSLILCKEFRMAGKLTLAVVATIAVNLASHAAMSLLRS